MHGHLLVAAVLATVNLVVVSGLVNFNFYKLSLQWPPSVCNAPGFNCAGSIPSTFTIHGLWPQITSDRPVPPYHPIRNRCTDVTPVNPDDILNSLRSIQSYLLTRNWPNLRNSQDLRSNQEFWKYEWKQHGMCSDYSNRPFDYFFTTVTLAIKYEPLQGTEIRPREELYQAKTISEAIKGETGAYPEIACNRVDGILQLKEVRLCFKRAIPPSEIIDCDEKYSVKCSGDYDMIRFTPPN